MFNECSSIEYINLTELKTSSVINMRRMFNGCKKLKNLDLHNFDTTYVTNMEEKFSECNSIKKLNLRIKMVSLNWRKLFLLILIMLQICIIFFTVVIH